MLWRSRSSERATSSSDGSSLARGTAEAFASRNSETVSSSCSSLATRLMLSGAEETRNWTSLTGLPAVKRTVFANLKTSFVESSDLSRSK